MLKKECFNFVHYKIQVISNHLKFSNHYDDKSISIITSKRLYRGQLRDSRCGISDRDLSNKFRKTQNGQENLKMLNLR